MDRARTDFPRTWEEVCNNPLLANLPCRVEINRDGNIELSPHSNVHSRYWAAIMRKLESLMKGGFTYTSCPIRAKHSNPVADVVWSSHARDAAEGRMAAACHTAPEICVEVRVPTDHQDMQEKRQEYFGAGAVEYWFCSLKGEISFYGPDGELERSRLCPNFPQRIKPRG